MLVHAHNLPRLLWVALISACCAHVVACGEGATTTKQKQLTSNATSSSSNGLELLDPADDVMAGVGESPTQTNTLANPTNKAATRAPQSKGAATSSNATSNLRLAMSIPTIFIFTLPDDDRACGLPHASLFTQARSLRYCSHSRGKWGSERLICETGSQPRE